MFIWACAAGFLQHADFFQVVIEEETSEVFGV